MRKLKILQYELNIPKTGAANYMLLNWKFINKDKFQFGFVVRSKYFYTFKDLKESRAIIHYVPEKYGEEPEKFLFHMKQIFLEGYDIAHIHIGRWTGFLIEEMAAKYCERVIVHSHSSNCPPFLKEKHDELKKAVSDNLVKNFWACSRLAADFAFGKQIPEEKINILKNAIDTFPFRFNRQLRKKYRAYLNLENSFVIGHVGNFHYAKNHEFLLKVFFQFYRKCPNAKLILAGGGNLEQELKDKVRKNKMENAVLFLGVRDDINCLLQAMDVFCLPSHFEGFPLSLVEAQTGGLPCLTSTNVTKEVAITKLLVYLPLNVEIWVQYLFVLRKSCNERRDMSKEISEAGFEIRTQIKMLEKLYCGN